MTIFPFAAFGRSMVAHAGVGQANLLAAGDTGGYLAGYDTGGTRSPVVAYPSQAGSVYELAFSNDGKLLAALEGAQIALYYAGGDMLLRAGTLLNAGARDLSWAGDDSLLTASTTGFAIALWRRDDLILTRIDDVSITGGIVESSTLSNDGTYLAVGIGNAPGVQIFKNNGADTFSKINGPATAPGDAVRTCAFSPDGNYLAVGSVSSPTLTVYSRSGDTLTKITVPTIPNEIHKLKWSRNSTYLAVAQVLGNNMTVLQRSGSTFSALTAPASGDLPASETIDCAFAADSAQVAFVDSGNHLYRYNISGTSLVKATTPSIPSRTWSAIDYSTLL